MTDENFTELVNLYFDKEISTDELKLLKSEIANCPDRKQAFAERLRLNRAMRLALEPERASSHRSRSRRSRTGSRRSSSHSRRRSKGRTRPRSRPATKISQLEDSVRSTGRGSLPRWVLASGAAASLIIGLVLLPPVFRDTTNSSAQSELVGVDEDELDAKDPLENLGSSEFRRFAESQRRPEAKHHASLISQMRLMGLRPELTPKDKKLREVRTATLQKPKYQVDQAELFRRIQSMNSIPETEILRLENQDSDFNSSEPVIFESSLVGFEEL